MSNVDTYRDAFLQMLADGATYLEAYQKFDETMWREAMNTEIMCGGTKYNHKTFVYETKDGKPSLLDLASRAHGEERNLKDLEQAIELMGAGWVSERPNGAPCQVMSLYWRAPSKRPPKPGRRYLSTNQAFNALKKLEQKS